MAQPQPGAQSHGEELRNADGSWKYTNALVGQTSPYLLQHAHNPVDWYPWGPEGFAKARQTGKPIFLSIGYSTCYWCHVMERQVFENPTLADLLNKHFVSIKVDREERPDVDDIYMAAVQIMTRHGGWPMSVFLTPPGAGGPQDKGLKPFWAGTYIPPEPAHGMPGFGGLVLRLSEAWEKEREAVIEQADRVAEAVKEQLTQRHGQTELNGELVHAAANQLVRSYDPVNGGFGSGAQGPKFPQPNSVGFLMAVHKNNPNAELWTAIAYTLERMATGGMYDQVGGGFHRYSTDGKWLVPHFEKMLYDNGQLLELYCEAQEIQPHAKDPGFYERVIRETSEYVLREMTNDVGDHLFLSAQDAEVDAHEGQNYLWTDQQVRDVISDKTQADLATAMYGLDKGTNFQDPHNPDAAPANVLYLPVRLDKLASDRKLEIDQVVSARQKINALLLSARDRRKQPITDDKVIVSWNGLMIAGLARAGRVLDEPRYTQAAAVAADDILRLMRGESGRLLRTRREGESKIPAFLEDYAFFTHGLLELHRTTQEDKWLEQAKLMMLIADELFSAKEQRGGGYYDTLPDQDDLFVRSVSTYDGAISSGNSQMVHNLISLYELTDHRGYMDRAVADLRASAGAMEQFGSGMSHMQRALLRALEHTPKMVAKEPGDKVPDGSIVVIEVSPGSIDLERGEASLRVTVNIQEGYHLNGDSEMAEGLVPTTLRLEGMSGFTADVAFPKAATKEYDFADRPIEVYEDQMVIEVRVRREATAAAEIGGGGPRLVFGYQACTETACMMPSTIELPIEVTGLPQ